MSSPDPLHTGDEKPREIKEAYPELDFTEKDHSLLSCPKCNHFINGADIDIEKTIAKCSHCNHVFGFAHDSASGQLKPEQIIPEGVEVLKLKSELDIRLNWLKTTSTGSRTFMLLFTGIWNLILLPFVMVIIATGNWGILLFMSLHLAVGFGLIWYLASIYVNKTSLSITKRKLRIRTMPLRNPLFKAREIDTNDLKQLYVSKYTQSTTNGVPNFAYALYAILADGEKVSLLRGMNRQTQQYIEKEIEGYLGIRNLKVPEETS
jgi:hypothetical protein